MKRILALGGMVAALLSCPAAVRAQTAQVGTVSGQVNDATGAALPGATVVLASEERGVSRTTTTGEDGRFLFGQVAPGRYDVTVTLNGFSTRTVKGNLVEPERTTSVPVSLQIATVEVATTVTGSVPIVDATNQTQEMRLRAEEFQKMPFGRSYQALIGMAPGVVGTGNVNAHGALTSNNQFLFDGVNTTDPTTGTFGANLNFEAIQEVVVRTGSVSAEYGRATGAIVDVITKSGTNRLSGSFKFLATNDAWNAQNTTHSEVDQTSLARTRFDQVNKTYTGTVGGPIIKNRAWYFVAYEDARATSPQTQLNARPGITPENFQQTTKSPFLNARGTVQLSPSQNVWVRVTRSPTNGFVRNDYWAPFIPAERASLTQQDQGGTSVAGQYTTVLSQNWTAEAMVAYASSYINVFPFERTTLNNGAPYIDLIDNRVYNGATFDGFVKRPRTQATAAANYYTTRWGTTHNVKIGLDWQGFESQNSFRFPNNQIFYGNVFNPATRTFSVNEFREDYDDAPSKSSGHQLAVYARDKFQITPRASVEAGVRVEKQTGRSDIDVLTVDTTSVAPRVSGSYALTRDSRTLILGSYGRFYDSILQGFSDNFANVPQQTNYSTYVWNGSDYVFSSRSESDANTFEPNTDISPRTLDEFTVGFERQIGQTIGATARYIYRTWDNFVDDVNTFAPDGTRNRVVTNIPEAFRNYKAIELTLEKRFSNRWSAQGNYTFSKTRGNHFGDDFTVLGDFPDATCRQTVDPGLFGGGTFPCSEVFGNLTGVPTYDRPHLFKFNTAYVQPVGPVALTLGVVGNAASKPTYTRQRTISVLSPVTGTQFATETYFYEPRGSNRVPGMLFTLDFSLEAVYRLYRQTDVGFRFETFNLLNNEEKINVSNLNWCNATTGSCATTVANFGTATTRSAFQQPRTIRGSFVVRF